jgi:HAD superfamily hydrolase (TIGR01509 family)
MALPNQRIKPSRRGVRLMAKGSVLIAAVLFDLYETLITESAIRPARASSLAATLGLEENAYRTEWKKRRSRVVRGEMSFADALAEISRSLMGRADIDTIQRIRQERIREKAAAYAQIDKDVAGFITVLARRGIGLAVISNGFQEDVVGWSHCSLAPKFHCTMFSCAEHVAKPDPEIYLRAVRRLGAKPAAAVYIGDGADDELVGAKRAGLRPGRAAWFVRDSPQKGIWPELTSCEDVLKFIGAG